MIPPSTWPTPWTFGAGWWLQAAILAAYVVVQSLMLLYSAHRYHVLWRWSRQRRRRVPEPPAPERWPVVTVQLPVYNERLVVERLIDAAAALDYPAGRLEIQVLDDSDDDTSERAAAAVARHRARGVDIHHRRRPGRDGFKAGALKEGLAAARGELIAVFDADFVPPADFLRRLVPNFADPAIGMAQARWGHLNERRSLMTIAQATMLDAHFLLEHAARMGSGLFFNFNGSAGVWRRACIESAGGWSSDTLTEDLDLSYRAQLAGWRFHFDPAVVARAELPAEISALKSQQRRWAKGSIQTARKILPRVARGDLPLRVRIESFFHLTANVAYPLLLALCVLLLPVLVATAGASPALAAVLDLAVILVGVIPVAWFLLAGRIAAGASRRRAVRDVVAALVLGAGLSVCNTRAVLEGLGRKLGEWERTPKTGDGVDRVSGNRYARSGSTRGSIEIALAIHTAVIAALAWNGGHRFTMPLLALLVAGFAYVGWKSVEERGRRQWNAETPRTGVP